MPSSLSLEELEFSEFSSIKCPITEKTFSLCVGERFANIFLTASIMCS